MERGQQGETVVAVDLFCGAGGFSEGLSQACSDLGLDLREAAVNHWDRAIETHEANHIPIECPECGDRLLAYNGVEVSFHD